MTGFQHLVDQAFRLRLIDRTTGRPFSTLGGAVVFNRLDAVVTANGPWIAPLDVLRHQPDLGHRRALVAEFIDRLAIEGLADRLDVVFDALVAVGRHRRTCETRNDRTDRRGFRRRAVRCAARLPGVVRASKIAEPGETLHPLIIEAVGRHGVLKVRLPDVLAHPSERGIGPGGDIG